MARYSAFLGRSVEVQYRAGDILLPASGTFVADSGRSIFLEQTIEQRGQHKHFRWEIPYQYLVRIEEKGPTETATNQPAGNAVAQQTPSSASFERTSQGGPEANSSAASSAAAANSSGPLLPLPHRS